MGDYIIKLDIWCILFLQGNDSKIEILKKQDFIESSHKVYWISKQLL